MKKLILVGACLAYLPAIAMAASLTLPSVTVSGQTASTTITCSAYPTLAAPVAAGTVLTTCTVAPAGWSGAVSLSGTQFVVSGLAGTSFTVVVGGTALAAGTYQPGTLTSVP